MTNQKIAEALHAYMEYRAKEEGVGHEFSVRFYRNAIKDGVRTFFFSRGPKKVTLGSPLGGVSGDGRDAGQQPDPGNSLRHYE